VLWKAEGGVILMDGQLSFEYFACDVGGRGVTKDMFRLSPTDGTIRVTPGEFTHHRKDGQQVMGIVLLRKMSDARDFVWAPDNIPLHETSLTIPAVPSRPAPAAEPGPILASLGRTGNVIIGDMSGAEGKPALQEVRLIAGDLQTLRTALSELEVPGEAVQELESVLRAEPLGAKTLGQGAADWVGRMVSRAITGAWSAGRFISPDVLTGMLKHHLGIKN
jgi:hypothetical protein